MSKWPDPIHAKFLADRKLRKRGVRGARKRVAKQRQIRK